MPTRPAATPPPAPSDETVRELLGPEIHALYDALLGAGPFRPEWKYYGPRNGWSLKLFEGKRNLCFVRPDEGVLHVGFVLGEAAVASLLDGSAPEALKELVRSAPRYPEGRGVRLNVTGADDLAQVRVLLEAKRARK